MWLEGRKRISIKDLNIGDMVVGMHVNKQRTFYKIVAGKITSKTTAKEGLVTYHVKGKILGRINAEPVNLSGTLEENEVEIIDPGVCNAIIKLYEAANKQYVQGLPGSAHENAEKAREMRHKSRQELEQKYAVGESNDH